MNNVVFKTKNIFEIIFWLRNVIFEEKLSKTYSCDDCETQMICYSYRVLFRCNFYKQIFYLKRKCVGSGIDAFIQTDRVIDTDLLHFCILYITLFSVNCTLLPWFLSLFIL